VDSREHNQKILRTGEYAVPCPRRLDEVVRCVSGRNSMRVCVLGR
jgi:hypothetical protein